MEPDISLANKTGQLDKLTTSETFESRPQAAANRGAVRHIGGITASPLRKWFE
jgi:hypothetical protein